MTQAKREFREPMTEISLEWEIIQKKKEYDRWNNNAGIAFVELTALRDRLRNLKEMSR